MFPQNDAANSLVNRNGHGNGSGANDSSAPQAQPPASLPGSAGAAVGAHREHDLKVRNRDRSGNRLPWSFAFSIPTIEDRPLAETPLAEAVALIKQQMPIRADHLHHFYDEKLRPAYRRVIAVRDEEEARLAAYNAQAQRIEARIDAEQEALRGKRDMAVAKDRDNLVALDAPLSEAHREAAEKAARAGGAYDPENPSEACVLRHERRPLEAIAADLSLPWTPADKKSLMPALASWFTTLLIGVMIGLSIGVMARMLPADNIGGKPVLAALFALIGFAAALAGKWAVKHCAREAGQRYWLGLPWTNWAPWTAFTFLVGGALIVIDSFVEQEGLLAGVRLQNMAAALSGTTAGQHGTNEMVYFLAAVILTLGYVITSAWEGYLVGRYDACLNRVRARQETEFHAADDARRIEVPVQETFTAVGRVRDLLRHKAQLMARIAEAVAPWEERIARAEAKRLTERAALSEEARLRVQDALDGLHGAQGTFDQMFDEALSECELPSSFWQRFLRTVRGYRAPRGHARERRRRIA